MPGEQVFWELVHHCFSTENRPFDPINFTVKIDIFTFYVSIILLQTVQFSLVLILFLRLVSSYFHEQKINFPYIAEVGFSIFVSRLIY